MTQSSFSADLFGRIFHFTADETCFSPCDVDRGTASMLSIVSFSRGQKVLDLGCGYGCIGIYAASIVGDENVFMTDIHENSLRYARKNSDLNGLSNITVVKSDGFSNFRETNFDLMLSNPPYHSDFSVPKNFLEKGYNRLRVGGVFFMVTKRKEWYKNKYLALFGGVKIHEINGYFIFEAKKRNTSYAKNMRSSP